MPFNKEIAATIAMAQVTGTPVAFTQNRGFATLARTGAGVYTLDYEQTSVAPGNGNEQDPTELNTQVSGRTAGLYTTHEYTSPTRLTVKCFDAAGSAADGDFDVIVSRTTNNETPPQHQGP